jgi:Spy/CpxP family protein refolding chaperone
MSTQQLSYSMALGVGLLIVLSGAALAQSGMIGGHMSQSGQATEPSPKGMMGMMGPQKMRGRMGGMQDRPEGMGMQHPRQLARKLQEELGLSDEQARQLRQLFSQTMKLRLKQQADLRIAELELQELLEADAVDMGQVEAKLKAIEGLRTQLRLTLIKGHEQAKGVLTPEQRQKLTRLHDRLPGMMGMSEMMGEGGSGGMGMMGQGGMGEQPHSATQMAGMPQNLTQQDTQGAVTVTATLLTPDKPRPDGKLAVQVKLDTHAVELDQYQLEKLAVLRDAQGREIHALELESPSGSGHHREGVLTFPGTDASGKPVLSPEANALTLIIRSIGGVPERLFRWRLPLG